MYINCISILLEKWVLDYKQTFLQVRYANFQWAHEKKWTASLATMEMQIKTTVRYSFTPTKMTVLKQTQISVTRTWKNRDPLTLLNVKRQSCFGKQSSSSTNGQVFLPCDPTMLLLGTYPRETAISTLIKIGTWVFTAALFITVPKWRQSKQPSAN